MIRLIIRLTFILIYLLNNIFSLNENHCYDSQMKLERSKFYLDNYDNRIIFIDSGDLKIFNYKLTNSFNLKINYKTTIKNTLNHRFFYGLIIKNNLIFENLDKKISLLYLNNVLNNTKRYMFDKLTCRYKSYPNELSKYRFKLPEIYSRKIDEDQKYLSLLFSLCELSSKSTHIHVLKSDDQELIIMQLNSINNKDLILRIKPSVNQTNDSVSIDHTISYNQNDNLNDKNSIIYLDYKNELNEIELPEQLKSFFKNAINFFNYKIGNQKYLILIEKLVTLVHEVNDDFLLNTVEKLLNNKKVSNIKLPILIDYFPNNYWYNCDIPLCVYSDMDLIINFEQNPNQINLKAFKKDKYFDLKLDNQNNDNSTNFIDNIQNDTIPIEKLKIENVRPLKELFTNLIKDKDRLDKEIYEEFLNLNNLDAGDYLNIDDKNRILFLIKNNYVYQLYDKINNNKLDQKLDRIDLQNFFNKEIKFDSHVQSVFTNPIQKKLIVLLNDGQLLQFSYLNYLKEGLIKLNDKMEINSTFNLIKSSFSFKNLVYIFSKHHYQIFKLDNNFKSIELKKIIDNFLIPCFKTKDKRINYNVQFKLINYKQTSYANDLTQKSNYFANLSNKLIVQLIVLIIVFIIIIILITIFYIRKSQRNLLNLLSRRESKKSIFSGTSANLSNLFNLAKTSSEKDEKSKTNRKSDSLIQSSKFNDNKLIDDQLNVSKLDDKLGSSKLTSSKLTSSKLASSKLVSSKLDYSIFSDSIITTDSKSEFYSSKLSSNKIDSKIDSNQSKFKPLSSDHKKSKLDSTIDLHKSSARSKLVNFIKEQTPDVSTLKTIKMPKRIN